MKRILTAVLLAAFTLLPYQQLTASPPAIPLQTQVEEENDAADAQVPMPWKDRVPNRSGIQCVWCSIETLARWAEITTLYDLTDVYKRYGDPGPAASVLKKYGIKYVMQYPGNKNTDILKRGCETERRGVAIGTHHGQHMMVLIHFDEKAGIAKYINNSDFQNRQDQKLIVHTIAMKDFMNLWTGWAILIYGEPDKVPLKFNPWRKLKIVDINGNELKRGERYIPIP